MVAGLAGVVAVGALALTAVAQERELVAAPVHAPTQAHHVVVQAVVVQAVILNHKAVLTTVTVVTVAAHNELRLARL